MKRVPSGALVGVEGVPVDVEVSLTSGLPGIIIVGLGGKAVQESRERVKAVLNSVGYQLPPQRITINLSPAGVAKEGSHFDLPIALGILFHDREEELEEYLILGELGLDGRLKETPAIFPIILSLRPKKVIIPLATAPKVAQIPGIEIYPFQHIQEVLEWKPHQVERNPYNYPYIKIGGEKYYYSDHFPVDFSEVKGQRDGKDGALLSATGFHNILLEGSPGVGKSMIIKRLRYILPPLKLDEILEIEKMRVLEGQKSRFEPVRPFRSPHHSATPSAIFGGGSREAKIGEIALAHKGILFFDELPHFKRDVLENLRLPLQEQRMLISRVNNKIEYKTDILFAGAMNPCPCGNLLSPVKECRCTPIEIARYKKRLSQPLLERIGIYVEMVEEPEPTGKDSYPVTSRELQERVLTAFEVAGGKLTARLPENYQFNYTSEVYSLLQMAVQKFGLSHRAQFNLMKLALTSAHLNRRTKIEKNDFLFVLRFRPRPSLG
jgi:magnesium chelatase family protein